MIICAPSRRTRQRGSYRNSRAPDRLVDHPRIGERLDAYAPREVRRIFVGTYELRYEIADAAIFILRLWHTRENRGLASDE